MPMGELSHLRMIPELAMRIGPIGVPGAALVFVFAAWSDAVMLHPGARWGRGRVRRPLLASGGEATGVEGLVIKLTVEIATADLADRLNASPATRGSCRWP